MFRLDALVNMEVAEKGPARSRSFFLRIGAPGEIRTPGLLVRSQALYPTELRAQMTERGRSALL